MDPFFHAEVQSHDTASDRLTPFILVECLAQIKITYVRWGK